MSNPNIFLEKDKIENLVLRLICNEESSNEIYEDGKEKIEKSFEELYKRLEDLHKKFDRNDDRLFDVITDFAAVHDNVYFDMGFLAGARLVKKLR